MKLSLVLVLAVIPVAVPLKATDAEGLRVVDSAGRPVTGAAIEVWTEPRSRDLLARLSAAPLQAESDADGNVPLELPRIEGLLLLVDHPGFAPWVEELLPERRSRTIRLIEGRRLTGVVRSESTAVARARLCASWSQSFERWGRERRWERCADAGQEGRFGLPGLPSANVDLLAQADGFLADRRQIAEEALDEAVAIELAPGILLLGRVTDWQGRALSRATVAGSGNDETSTTVRDGGFELAVASLPVTLEARATGFHPERVRIATLPDRLSFRLRAAEQLTVSLLGDDGAPPEKGTLVVESKRGGHRTTETYATDEESGELLVSLPGPGQYAATAVAAGYQRENLGWFEIGAGETVDLGTVVLSLGAGVRGEVHHGESVNGRAHR